jgi:hypothetical protein
MQAGIPHFSLPGGPNWFGRSAPFFYYLFLEVLGYILTTFILMVLLLKAVESTRWRTVLLEAFVATFASYALFQLWLKVQLPKGIWPSLSL